MVQRNTGLVSFAWRATLFGLIGGFIFGAIAGFFVALFGRPELAPLAGAIAGYLVGIPVTMWCIKIFLDKSFNGYSVCLIKNTTE